MAAYSGFRGPNGAAMAGYSKTDEGESGFNKEEDLEVDAEDYEEDEGSDGTITPENLVTKRTNKRIVMAICAMACLLIVPAICLCIFSSPLHGFSTSWEPAKTSYFTDVASRITPTATLPDHIPVSNVVTLGAVVGLNNQYVLQGFILASVAWVCIAGSTALAAIVVVRSPEIVPHDFVEKGTLSNVCQDVSLPRGRIFTVSLFTSGMLLTTSMYTFWLYRCWIPLFDIHTNPLLHGTLQPRIERSLRSLWVVLPQVGFMFTAAIPSLTDTHGTRWCLMMVHNVCAPLSMLFNAIMETVQLSFGEQVFSRFFSSEKVFPYGQVSMLQRVRAVVLLTGWATGLTFLGVQSYLGVGSVLGVKIKKNYSIALVSFIAEVCTMGIVGMLPALAGLDTLIEIFGTTSNPLEAAATMVIQLDYPFNLTSTTATTTQ